jgi:hypothetical protein
LNGWQRVVECDSENIELENDPSVMKEEAAKSQTVGAVGDRSKFEQTKRAQKVMKRLDRERAGAYARCNIGA